ncbi:MAG TPA: antitoxin VbhA family protein [Verrucomicrobiae bacterium]|nr:antitoxin VbhA family protein [Verrucomicrobiae bacterium]
MTSDDINAIIADVDASLAFEGLVAAPEARAIHDRQLRGEITADEAAALIMELHRHDAQ